MDYCAVQKEENLGKSRIPFFTDELYAAELSELERFLCQDVNLCSIYLSHNGLGVFNVQSMHRQATEPAIDRDEILRQIR